MIARAKAFFIWPETLVFPLASTPMREGFPGDLQSGEHPLEKRPYCQGFPIVGIFEASASPFLQIYANRYEDMTAYRYANIEKYLHGIAFKGASHMPCGQGLLARFAIWPPCFKQTGETAYRAIRGRDVS
jgi:hypothetical protein